MFFEHPIFVHFPIAFILLYILIEIINLFPKNVELEKFSLGVLLLAIIGGILSVITGNLSYQEHIINESISQLHLDLIEKHELLASLTLWYYFFLLVVRVYFFLKKKNEPIMRYLFTIFAVGGGYLLYNAAALGGKLVYDFGIGTNLLK